MKWLKKKAGIKTTLKSRLLTVKTNVKAGNGGNRLFDSQ